MLELEDHEVGNVNAVDYDKKLANKKAKKMLEAAKGIKKDIKGAAATSGEVNRG